MLKKYFLINTQVPKYITLLLRQSMKPQNDAYLLHTSIHTGRGNMEDLTFAADALGKLRLRSVISEPQSRFDSEAG